MGLVDRLRRRRSGRSSVEHEARVHVAALDGEVRWSQPFRWGLLLAFDAEGSWDPPGDVGGGQVVATRTCVAVPVLHASDVELDESADPDAPVPEAHVEVVLTGVALHGQVDFAGLLECPSGRLHVGDAEEHHLVDVAPGTHRVQVRLDPGEHAERVVLALSLSGAVP
jgi:hypothetical protein